MRRFESGIIDQFVYFNGGQVGLSSFTVYRSKNGAAAVIMTTPTINETDSTNMPGIYELLLDEDMSLAADNVTEQMSFWITHAGMPPVFLEIELFEPPIPTKNKILANLEFVFLAASDNVTPVTGATGTGVTRSIDGGAFGAGTGTIAEIGNGLYQYDTSAADVNGKIITFRFTASGGTPGAANDAFLTVFMGGA